MYSLDLIEAGPAIYVILAVGVARVDKVVGRASLHIVVAFAGEDLVVAAAAFDRVVPAASFEAVVSVEALGNLPHAFTHLSLITAVVRLDRALG